MVMLSTNIKRKLAVNESGSSRTHLPDLDPCEFASMHSKASSHEVAPMKMDFGDARRMFKAAEQTGTIAFIELLDTSEVHSLCSCIGSSELLAAREGLLRVDENDNELDLENGAGSKDTIEPVFWTPNADQRYGPSHQAALESALSTVLNVSTLVSSRVPEPSRKEQVNLISHRVSKVNNQLLSTHD